MQTALTYTANGQVSSATDANGNRTGYGYDAYHRLAETHYPSPTTPGASSGTDYEGVARDANGQVTALRTRDGLLFTFGYDGLGRLASKTPPSGTQERGDADLRPLGRLYRTQSAALGKTDLLYDGDQLVAEYDGDTGSMRRRYMFGPGVDEPILWEEESSMNCSGTRFLHTDYQGSVVALADCYGNRTNADHRTTRVTCPILRPGRAVPLP